MKRLLLMLCLLPALSPALNPGTALAHATPPVVYLSDQDAVRSMTSGAKKRFVREVKLTPEERRRIESKWGWSPEDPSYRFYLGRDEQGQLVSAVTFLTAYTTHGAMRMAVALGPDGKVRDARIAEVSEEISTWVDGPITGGFFRRFVGLDSGAPFDVSDSPSASTEDMVHFYRQVGAQLIQHGAILFDVAFLRRGEL